MSRPIKRTLCGTCADLLRRGYYLKKIAGGIDNKITCDNCGKRRYGYTYEVTPKQTGGQDGK